MTDNNTPPADDVREALTKRAADEVEYRVRTAVTLAMNGHEYEQHITQGRESVAAILAEVRPHGTVTDADDVHESLRAIADGDGPEFVREFAREALAFADAELGRAYRALEAARESQR